MRRPGLVLIGCGALARELAEACRMQGLVDVELELLPPGLHDRPDAIPEQVRARVRAVRHDRPEATIVVGYADCGTGGLLDAVCVEEGVERLPGAHCYELFAGTDVLTALQRDEPGTFYLTDFLVRAFDRLVIRGLGLDRHPQLRDVYFGAYTRVVYLRQRADAGLEADARRAAALLGLPLEVRHTGVDGLARALVGAISRRALPVAT